MQYHRYQLRIAHRAILTRAARGVNWEALMVFAVYVVALVSTLILIIKH